MSLCQMFMISGVRIGIALLEVANITTDHPLSAKYENVVSTVRYLGQHYTDLSDQENFLVPVTCLCSIKQCVSCRLLVQLLMGPWLAVAADNLA